MSSLTRALVYAGLEKEELAPLMPEARAENGRFLRIYSAMTVLVFVVCLILSFVARGQLVVNRPIYIFMILACALIFLCNHVLLPKHEALSTPLSVCYMLSMYAYSFTVSLLHADMQGTAAVAILLVMPCIFNYRPYQMIAMTIGMASIYCILSAQFKTHSLAMLDLWNTLFFGTIAVLLAVYQMRVKFRMLQQKRNNRILSETDLLTGCKNRNCFEGCREDYERLARASLTCVYADANGLHELNDTQGHEAGDRMLCAVAKAMTEKFGQDNTYRIGGDEFVAFCLDLLPEQVRTDIAQIVLAVSSQGYSVSVGTAHQARADLDMDALLKEAEQEMYREKQQYYQTSGRDRRKR